MGVIDNITHDRFPKQGRYLGLRAEVMFHYGGPAIGGRIVRDDREDPWETVIALDDGRYVLATECQYRPVGTAAPGGQANEPVVSGAVHHPTEET